MHDPNPTNQPSLLEGLDEPVLTGKRARTPKGERRSVGAAISAWFNSRWSTPRGRAVFSGIGAALIIGAGLGAYFTLRPVPQPDYEFDDIDMVFDYTLLTDEFNNLPVEERLALIRQLIERLRSLEGNQSPMLAAFAAGIAGAAREQIEENISRLALDSFDLLAQDYNASAPPAEREAYAEQSFVEIQKFFESIAGFDRDLTDEERVAEGQRQAQRDLRAIRNGEFSSSEAGRVFSFMNESIGRHASPHQKARATVLLRDISRTLRGQGVDGP